MIVWVLFYRLVIVVDNSHLKFYFGIGLIKGKFSLPSIQSVKAIKISALSGIGIRVSGKYILYNVDASDGIELSLSDQTQKVRIGTDKSTEIISFIQKAGQRHT